MSDYIDIKTLTLEELAGVVNLYPWFGAARKEMCVRMSSIGGNEWGTEQYSDAALYVGNRGAISDIVRSPGRDWSDKDIRSLLDSLIREAPSAQGEHAVRAVGGDFFTQSQYDKVRREDDNVFSRYAARAKEERREASAENLTDEFCTETLAQIYLEQGYYEQAKHIYSRLLLNFPEKNAYFAALIEKMDEEIKEN